MRLSFGVASVDFGLAACGCQADVLHDPLRRRFRVFGFLSHLHSLMVTMSQKSSVPQAVKSVSLALMSDMPSGFLVTNKIRRSHMRGAESG
jgi:hypothetical protein